MQADELAALAVGVVCLGHGGNWRRALCWIGQRKSLPGILRGLLRYPFSPPRALCVNGLALLTSLCCGLRFGDPESCGVLAVTLVDHLAYRQAAAGTSCGLANSVLVEAVFVIEVFATCGALAPVSTK
jgi:hypothetical protein